MLVHGAVTERPIHVRCQIVDCREGRPQLQDRRFARRAVSGGAWSQSVVDEHEEFFDIERFQQVGDGTEGHGFLS